MPEKLKKILNPADLEYLSMEQAASLCMVSLERFNRWVERGMVPVIEHQGQLLIRAQDLIQHLISHNIRIPERLLQGRTRKILFILMEQETPESMSAEILYALYRLCKDPRYIFDFIEYDTNTELKVITFAPDCIFLLHKECIPPAAEQRIQGMAERAIPVHSFSLARTIDLDAYFSA